MTLPRVFADAASAVADVGDGAAVMVGGFAGAGIPYTLLDALADRPCRRLTVISNNTGDHDIGIAAMILAGQVAKVIVSYPGHPSSSVFAEAHRRGEVELELVPQGTLAERIRAGGAGIGGFLVRTGVDTDLADPARVVEHGGTRYLLESPLRADFSLVRAHRADRHGNLQYRQGMRNFNPVMAAAGTVTVVEVDEICDEPLDPEFVHTPGVYVDRLVLSRDGGANPVMTVAARRAEANGRRGVGWTDEEIAQRVARALPEGAVVNLGIGLPTLVAEFAETRRQLTFHSENGLVGIGAFADAERASPYLVNSSRQAVTLRPGGAYVDQAESFAMIRGGHIDITVLGAYEVSATGDLANWCLPGSRAAGGVGGAMDLAVGAGEVWAMMRHTTKHGEPRLRDACRYPLTGAACVRRVFTELGEFFIDDGGVTVVELAPGVEPEHLAGVTGCELRWREHGTRVAS